MRAGSVGLEVEIHLDSKEILNLKDSSINGFLRFREVNEDEIRREIPVSIALDKEQKELLEVDTIPKGIYFGRAEKIKYVINSNMYECLLSHGWCGDRYWSSGKLLIHKGKVQIIL